MTSMTYTRYASLKDRLVFISGGSSGIGAELVQAFAAQGASVAFCGTQADGGRTVIEQVRAAGHAAPHYRTCDVRDVDRYQAVLRELIAELGPVRVLINNAGRDDRHAMEDVTSAMWDDRLALNLKHYFFAIAPGDSQALAAALRRLAADEPLRAQIAARGRTVYAERACRRVLGERWRSLLDSVQTGMR